jgi:hypothetical protein
MRRHIPYHISGYLLSMGLVFLMQGCREPFDPPIDRYENVLVVDGLITDREGPHEVRLSRTFPFNERYPEQETGALVLVRTETLDEFQFAEESAGLYRSEPDLKGVPGHLYQLFIVTSDGEQFESEWVELKPVPEIDSITYGLSEITGESGYDRQYGVEIRVNSHDPENSTRYYRYEWLETWEFLTPIASSFYLDEQRCWRSNLSTEITIATTDHLKSDILEEYPLYTVTTGDNRLAIRYSVLVTQFAMSRETYSYWKELQDVTQNSGTLFDPLPNRVEGNITHLPDGEVPVLGIFQASAAVSQRIFIDREDLPDDQYVPGGFESCNFYTTSDTSEMDTYLNQGFIFVDEYVDGNTLYKIFTESPVCFRCTYSGTNQRPEYWTEED